MPGITCDGRTIYNELRWKARDPMTQIEFDHLLASVDALSPGQMRRLLRQLESRMATIAEGKQPSRKAVKRGRSAPPEPLASAELDQYMVRLGLMSQLPDTAADFDDPADEPVSIKGEPLSETIIRERR